jgi:cytochrome P450
MAPRPSRFAPGNVIPPGAWLPFSGGQRNCIGMRFALLEGTLVLATLAQRFSFASQAPQTMPCRMSGVIQKPVGGIKVTLTPRAVHHE